MMFPASPVGERDRLSVLHEMLVLDSGSEAVFDSIARTASEVCGTPIALISLIDEDRQWFKANVGLQGVTQTPRKIAFCAHAILEDGVFEVADAAQDARFADNPLVTGAPHIRFYAGAPLVLEGGERIGTLCVIDRSARQLDASQLRMLSSLAEIARDALSMRRDLIHRSLSVRSEYEQALQQSEMHYRAIVEDQNELISLAQPDGTLSYVNPAYARHFGQTPAQMQGRNLFDFIAATDHGAVRELMDTVLRTGQSQASENGMVAADGTRLWVAWTNGVQRDAAGVCTLHSVGRDITARKRAEQALRASESFLYRTGRAAGVGGWELDLTTGALTWSEETRRIHEVGPGYQPTLERAIEFYAVEARASIQATVQGAIDTGEPWDIELPFVTAMGRHLWVRAVGEVEFAAGLAVRLIGAFQDVTERKRLEHSVASQAATLRLVAEAIPATVAVVDLAGRYRFVNSAFEQICGRTRDRIIGLTALEVMGEQEFERCAPGVQRALAGESAALELDYPGAEGPTYRAISFVPLRLSTGEVDGFVVVGQDVTQQRRESQRLLALSKCDALTGLLNRAGFEEYIQRQISEGSGTSLALLYIDLDHFKPVNDTHGHATGDQVLKLFGQRLHNLVRPTDAVARLGGDEFAVALAGARELANARVVADKVLAAAQMPFKVGELVVCVAASVGVAFGADLASGWADLLERADAQLLSAKAAGKGRQEVEAIGH